MLASPPTRSARTDPLVRLLLGCALILLALGWWSLADALPEGSILWTFAPGRGLTMGDLPGVVVIAAAVPVLWPLRRHLRPTERSPQE